MNHDIELDEQTVRPFRIWHEHFKKELPWRRYKYLNNARISAWIAAKQCNIGHSLTVIDRRNGKELGTYTRRIKSVTFTPEVKYDNV